MGVKVPDSLTSIMLNKIEDGYRSVFVPDCDKFGVYLYNTIKENPHIQFNADNKRRKLEENQGRGISKDQWYEMFNFFEWKCAYSDIQLNENNRSIDHIIALNNNGLNEPWNCVPMYRPYNTSKYISNMEEWYKKQEFYSEERLQKIYAWCEYAFKKWKPRRKGNKKSSGK